MQQVLYLSHQLLGIFVGTYLYFILFLKIVHLYKIMLNMREGINLMEFFLISSVQKINIFKSISILLNPSQQTSNVEAALDQRYFN